jgi:hypothetical protein
VPSAPGRSGQCHSGQLACGARPSMCRTQSTLGGDSDAASLSVSVRSHPPSPSARGFPPPTRRRRHCLSGTRCAPRRGFVRRPATATRITGPCGRGRDRKLDV